MANLFGIENNAAARSGYSKTKTVKSQHQNSHNDLITLKDYNSHSPSSGESIQLTGSVNESSKLLSSDQNVASSRSRRKKIALGVTAAVGVGAAVGTVLGVTLGRRESDRDKIINAIKNDPVVRQRFITGAQEVAELSDQQIQVVLTGDNLNNFIDGIPVAAELGDTKYGCFDLLHEDCLLKPIGEIQSEQDSSQTPVSPLVSCKDNVNQQSYRNALDVLMMTYTLKVHWCYGNWTVTSSSATSTYTITFPLGNFIQFNGYDNLQTSYNNYSGHGPKSELILKETAHFSFCTPAFQGCLRHYHANARTYLRGDGSSKESGEFIRE